LFNEAQNAVTFHVDYVFVYNFRVAQVSRRNCHRLLRNTA